MNLGQILLLVVVLLVISAGGADVDRSEFIFEGEHEVSEHQGALIVGDANVTVPQDETVSGPVYVIGGELQVQGTVERDVTQLSGSLVVGANGAINGELQHIGGTETFAEGAMVADRSPPLLTADEPDPIAVYAPVVVVTLVLALVGGLLARTRQALLDTVGTAAHEHPMISLTVGAFLTVTFLAVFVFMAFTLILIPVSILGVLTGLVIIGYGIIALGHLVGQQLQTERVSLATAVGVVGVMVFFQVVTVIPILGDLIVVALLMTGLGAVVLTYFGLQEFKPVALPN